MERQLPQTTAPTAVPRERSWLIWTISISFSLLNSFIIVWYIQTSWVVTLYILDEMSIFTLYLIVTGQSLHKQKHKGNFIRSDALWIPIAGQIGFCIDTYHLSHLQFIMLVFGQLVTLFVPRMFSAFQRSHVMK